MLVLKSHKRFSVATEAFDSIAYDETASFYRFNSDMNLLVGVTLLHEKTKYDVIKIDIHKSIFINV